jgi:branched-chain amino acid aminotransferase
MLVINWEKESGWAAPEIRQYGNLSLDPASSVLHYANTCFEGMKAYKSSEGRILTFRPDKNMHRLNSSCEALLLPTFDANELLGCIDKLLEVEEQWIP